MCNYKSYYLGQVLQFCSSSKLFRFSQVVWISVCFKTSLSNFCPLKPCLNLMQMTLNLKISLGRKATLVTLSLPIHEYSTSSHLWLSPFISLRSGFSFSVYKYYTLYFVRLHIYSCCYEQFYFHDNIEIKLIYDY